MIRRTRRLIVGATVLAVVGVAPLTMASAASAQDAKPEVLATLKVTAEKVEVKKADGKKFKVAEDGDKLREGDTIRTDATGTAEVDYGNDSYTRLDVNTTFAIKRLTEEQGSRQVQGSLEAGQAWHRAAAVTESGSFEQEGAGANATVLGTAFAVTCVTPDSCNFQAVVDDIELIGRDGVTRLLTPLTQCASTEPDGDAGDGLTGVLCEGTTPIPPDQLPAWILKNLFADVLLGLPDGGILTGTLVIDEEAGTVTFVPGPQPSSGGGPVAPAGPVIDGVPIDVEYKYVTPVDAEEVSGSTFSPSSEIRVGMDGYASFKVRIVSSPGGQLYVVFLALPKDVGKVCSTPALYCDNVQVRDGAHPDARYPVETVFDFTPGNTPATSTTGLQFLVETEDGVPSEPSTEVPVIVEGED